MPPLNGFVSEWLLFQAVIAAPALPQAALHFASPAIGAMLALAAALAAACFVRVYGTAFLGRPRSAEAAGAHDVPLAQQIAMGGLAFLCILGGLFGSVLAMALAPVAGQSRGRRRCPAAGSGPTPFSLIAFDPARSIYDAPVIALFVAIASLTTLIVVHRLSARRTAPRPGLGLRLSRPVAGHAVHRLELRPAVAPRVRRRGLRGAGDGRHAAARRHPAGALLGGRWSIICGGRSTRRPAGPSSACRCA